MKLEEIIPLVSLLLAITSIFVAFLSFFNSRKRNKLDEQTQEDKDLSDYAILLLEKSYKVLTDDGENTTPPKASRLNWLTSARLILRYNNIRSQIKTVRYQLICDESAEQWGHEFYKILKSGDFNHPGYYSGNLMLNSCENIEPNSAVVITEFSKWGEDYKDPIDTYAYKDSLAKKPKILDGHIGLQVYLSNLDEEGARKHNKKINKDT
ncbi:hypothetical protein [Colwellia hornerae]|uniref:Uncharacterized protein n=1 Tax=Colwellia hornerae TaxID=89402 RepID=A0A5C6Q280_9GAMM|nr:hypothetical protein [Colwellia hornerae]TWX44435.1 hypothetical protein ESZ28_18960 [Colwellia hornerae]TWX53444.1 hypothetical protein ESZ26_18815 [Colwellia hornerae]TWX62025.1 hypothetical protein ESZ27_19000 [Colwellia hornerae]